MESASGDPIRPPTSADEEAAKRNTDCVYFLASPLTCKKGSECEYRHSEGARINPRDCWFWLNGNCLNPKCSFRHPPLDGFLSTPTGTASGPSLPSAQTAITAQVPAAYAPSHATPNKQSTPCYFFQKGGCLKGDRCPYMHDMQPINGSNQQHPGKVAAPPAESPNMSKNPSWTREKAMLQNKLEIGAEKAVEVHESVTKSIVKVEVTPTSRLPVNSIMLPIPLADDMVNRFQPDNVAHSLPSTTEEPHDYHFEQVDECIRNGREPDDSLRESSPGFDVLVDDEPEDADYFQKDEEFGASEYASENLNLVNDFGYHGTNLDSVSNFEREDEIDDRGHHGRRDYRGHRRSSERMVKRSRVPERKGTWRENSPDKLDASDLRHRLLKQRGLNGPRSMINPDQYGEPCQRSEHVEDDRHRRPNSHRDQRNPSRESPISNRLQGRIKLPGRPSSDNYNNRHSEGLMERGGRWGRSSSPGQPLSSQSRHLDILKQRAYRDADAESRKTSAQWRPDEVDALNFAGPKSLSELKGAKFYGKSEVPLILNPATTNQQKKSEASLSFAGPKPLSVILKRKREEAQGSETDTVSSNGQGDGSNGQDDSQRVMEEHEGGCMFTTITDRKKFQPEDSENVEKQTDSRTSTMKSKVVVEEGQINSDVVPYEGGVLDTEERNLADNVDDPEVESNKGGNESEYQSVHGTGFGTEDGESLPPCDHSIIEEEILKTDDGMLVDDKGGPDQNYDQRDEECDYETANGTNVKTEDGEYMYEEDEDEDLDDDDDGDDFARKLGAMLS